MLLFVIVGVAFTSTVDTILVLVQSFIVQWFGWLYKVSLTLFLWFAIWLSLSRHGRIRFGADDEAPDYGRLTWFSMLFSAGMGIGVLFWSVAEPISHFQNPIVGQGSTAAAARSAITTTLFHWGLHGWSVYALVGLALAYFRYRRGTPLTIRAAFQPLLSDRAQRGAPGHALDIFAVLGTMFGVATTLGLGAQQINAGLHHLAGVAISTPVQVMLIGAVTLLATLSVVSGLDRGIRRLSQLTMALALLMLVYVLVTGPTAQSLSRIADSTFGYLKLITQQLLWASLGGDDEWQGKWTLFYWGWWIAWSPFVGTFIARISRGRTIREFILGALLVPSAVTTVWFSVFGGMALDRVLGGDQAIAQVVQNDFSVAIYVFFEAFPLSIPLSLFGTILVVVFFVTSSDSASLVIDYLTSGGNEHPPVRQRVFWALTEGLVAAVLLIAGGLGPMRTFQIITGFPLCLTLVLMCLSILRALRDDFPAPY